MAFLVGLFLLTDFKGSDGGSGGAISSTCGWAKMEFDAAEEFEGAKKKFKWPDARKSDKVGKRGKCQAGRRIGASLSRRGRYDDAVW
jgi:hypothetical protein